MRERSKGSVLAIAVIVAVVYAAALGWLQWRYLLASLAGTHNLNILGDSIGGLTAPLALIFLIAAVIIQRQELALTKTELAKTAEAMAGQVIEQRQHREFVGQQTDMMRKEAEASAETTRKTYKLSLFDRRYGVYFQLKELRQSFLQENMLWSDMKARISDLSNQAHFLFPTAVIEWFDWIRHEIEEGAKMNDGLYVHLRMGEDEFGNALLVSTPEYEAAKAATDEKQKFIAGMLADNVLSKVFAESMSVTD